jgi:hypothetical protein
VNVDAGGHNIVGDAANEPSIAVDPTNSSKMAMVGGSSTALNLTSDRLAGDTRPMAACRGRSLAFWKVTSSEATRC